MKTRDKIYNEKQQLQQSHNSNEMLQQTIEVLPNTISVNWLNTLIDCHFGTLQCHWQTTAHQYTTNNDGNNKIYPHGILISQLFVQFQT